MDATAATRLASLLDVDPDLCSRINKVFAYECAKCQYEIKTRPAAAKRKRPRKKNKDVMVPDEAASTLLAMSSGRDLSTNGLAASNGLSSVILGEAAGDEDLAGQMSAAEQERYSRSQLFNGVTKRPLSSLCFI